MTASAELVRPRQRVEEERRQLPRTRPAAAAITAAQLGSRVAICTLPDSSPSDPASAEPLRTRRGSLAPSLGTGPSHSPRWQPFLPDAPHVGHLEPERGAWCSQAGMRMLVLDPRTQLPSTNTPHHLPSGLFFFLLLRMRRTREIIAWGSQ